LPSRGGLSALIASTRLILGNRFTRLLLKSALRSGNCLCEECSERRSLIYYALKKYSGVSVHCSLGAMFTIDLLDAAIKTSVLVLRGNDREVAEAFKDPAIRRGLKVF
jgi:hypothetical protein